MSRVIAPIFMLVAWLALWGEISVVNVGSGVLVVAIVSLVFRRVQRGRHRLHPIGLVKLLAIFVWRLVTSSATVVVTVLAPTPARLRSGVVGVELTHASPLVAAIVSDAISLTPGTLTLDAKFPGGGRREPPTLYIHVLGLADPDEIRRDVQQLEQVVLAAVTPYGLEDDDDLAPVAHGEAEA
ncbi:MAG: Na+/H+ antiporter subunit E [Actinomycetota bacterium]